MSTELVIAKSHKYCRDIVACEGGIVRLGEMFLNVQVLFPVEVA